MRAGRRSVVSRESTVGTLRRATDANAVRSVVAGWAMRAKIDEEDREDSVVIDHPPDGRLVEYVELPADAHPFYVGTQAHPEFRSRPTRAHPLFAALIEAAQGRHQGASVLAKDHSQAPVS